jgi:hypothetical protein
MVKVSFHSSIDVHKLQRLVRADEMLIGYPDGIMHPASEYLRHKVSMKTGKKLKGKERVASKGEPVENSKLAEWLHNGTAAIPARPFLYQSLADGMNEILKAIGEYHRERMRGKEGNLAKIGAIAIGTVQRFVRGGYYEGHIPNAPGTRRSKGSSKPLIDTAFLINSTTFVVRNLKKKPDQRAKLEASG